MSMCSHLSEKAIAPHSSILAWKIPWMEELGRLQSMESQSQTWLSDFTLTFHFHVLEKEMASLYSVLAWRIPGIGEPGGLPSMGSHRVRHDWSNLAAAAAVISCVVGRGCLLWLACSLGKTLLAFVLLHFVLQGQICLLLQVFLDFLICIPVPYNENVIFWGVSSRRSNRPSQNCSTSASSALLVRA